MQRHRDLMQRSLENSLSYWLWVADLEEPAISEDTVAERRARRRTEITVQSLVPQGYVASGSEDVA